MHSLGFNSCQILMVEMPKFIGFIASDHCHLPSEDVKIINFSPLISNQESVYYDIPSRWKYWSFSEKPDYVYLRGKFEWFTIIIKG